MTFTAIESSNELGRPVALYELRWGNTVWRYTSADTDQVWDSVTWTAVEISDDNLTQGNGNREEVKFTVPTNLPVVALFRGTPPSNRVTIVVRRLHVGDEDGEAPIHWMGRISNVGRLNPAEATLTCSAKGLVGGGLRLTWSRPCNYVLYGRSCRVVKADFAAARTITAVGGGAITVDDNSPSEGWFDHGFIEWDADGLGTIERRMIVRETASNRYQMFGRTDGLTVGLAVMLYPGCNLTVAMCADKFNNLANHGGYSFMSGKSIFDGQALA